MKPAVRLLRAVYPYLTAATPVVYLSVRNVAQVTPDQTIAPLVVLLVATALLLALASRWLGNRAQAGALVTLTLLLLFTGGGLYGLLVERLGPAGHWPAFAFATGLAIMVLLAGGRWITASPARLEAASTLLSVMALVLFANMALPLVVTDKGRTFFAPSRIDLDNTPEPHPVREIESAEFPDIYYIIADAYGRADALQRFYGFDNSEFLQWLEKRGFWIADRSWSNYAVTYQSLASSLNMRYVNDLGQGARGELDRIPFYRLIQRPDVAERLQRKGYRYAQVLTHWGGTDRSAAADLRYRFAPFLGDEFSGALANMTLLRAFAPTVDRLHHFVADQAGRIADEPGPTFAFVHLLLPHNPYVFNRHGDVVARYPLEISLKLQESAWALREPFVEQLLYTNVLLRRMIETILQRSSTPPIIIVQGDHGTALSGFSPQRAGLGTDPRERLAILNAYLVPAAMRERLYAEITPVNTFRTLLAAQFGDDLERLPDQSYFGRPGPPFHFEDVTAALRAPFEH